MVQAQFENEVWSLEQDYWKYVKAADVDSFLSLWHEDVIAWPNNKSMPVNKEGILQLFTGVFAMFPIESANIDVTPVSVRIYGDTGIVYYEVHTRLTAKDGTEMDTHERFTHTWLKRGEGWKIIGGMSAPLVLS